MLYLAWLIRCLLYGKTRKQSNKNINDFICFPARAEAFSWLSSVTGLQSKQSKQDENNRSKSSFVQTLSMDEDKLFIRDQWISLWLKQQFMKSDQKCNCNVSNACLCLQRSVLIQPCDLRLITTENVDVKCAAFELVNMRSGKNCLRLDLLDCEDILLCCSGGTDLVFFALRGCTFPTIQDSRHFLLSLERCWMVAVKAVQIFVTA